MTPGYDNSTMDGISWEFLVKTASDIQNGKLKFTPGRRIEIPKSDGNKRPLTITAPREKIIQEAKQTNQEYQR